MAWLNLIVSGSDAELANLRVDGAVSASQFSGSFFGGGSGLTGIVSSSYALSASWAPGIPSVSASYAQTASFVNQIFSEGGTFADPINGISFSSSFCVFRAPYSCQVQSIYGKRFGGSNCFINARKSGSNGYSFHTASNLILSSDNIWFQSNIVENTNYVVGDSLEIIISGSGNNQISVQVDLIRV